MIFEKNLLALEETGDATLASLLRNTPLEAIDVYETEAGDYTIEYQGICLHSAAGAIDEAKAVTAAYCKPDPQRVHVILGIGLGYLLDTVHAASPGKIVVYEPNLALLRFVFENVDLTKYLKSGRVWLFANQRDVREFLRRNISCTQEQVDVLTLPGHAAILRDDISALMPSLVEVVHDRVSDYDTMKLYHGVWVETFFQNILHYDRVLTADILKNRYTGKPAVVVGSGPSLDKAIDAIREMRNSVVLIAVNMGFQELAKHDIVPDFAVLYDATVVDKIIERIPEHILSQTTLLLGFLAHPQCYQIPAKSIIYLPTINNIQFCEWLDTALQTKEYRLEGGGTVSLVALQLGMLMGCDPLILVGQDLAYPDNQCYAGGVSCQLDETGTISLHHQEGYDYFPDQQAMLLPGQAGKPVVSTASFLRFIRHFEDIAERNRRSENPVALYNASIGGAHIEGYTVRPLDTFVAEFTSWKTPEHFDFPTSNPDREIRRDRLYQATRKLNQDVEELAALLENIESGFSLKEANLANRVIQANQQMLGILQHDVLLPYFLFFELGTYDQQYRPRAARQEDVVNNAKALMQFSADGRKKLQEMLPHLHMALERFEGSPVAMENQPVPHF